MYGHLARGVVYNPRDGIKRRAIPRPPAPRRRHRPAARGRPFLPAVRRFFLLSAALPRWTVPPRYDVLLRTRAYDQIGPMISVDVVVQEYPVFDCRVIE